MATKKSKSKTLRSQYETILADKGKKLAECKLLGFRFGTTAESYAFHFSLMNKHIPYYIYDGPENDVNLVIEKEHGDIITEMALTYHAEKRLPIID